MWGAESPMKRNCICYEYGWFMKMILAIPGGWFTLGNQVSESGCWLFKSRSCHAGWLCEAVSRLASAFCFPDLFFFFGLVLSLDPSLHQSQLAVGQGWCDLPSSGEPLGSWLVIRNIFSFSPSLFRGFGVASSGVHIVWKLIYKIIQPAYLPFTPSPWEYLVSLLCICRSLRNLSRS